MLVNFLCVFGVFGDRQGATRPLYDKAQAVVLAFPMSNELDVVHMKMTELDAVVDWYVIAESCRTNSGKPKTYRAMRHMRRQPRFKSFLQKVIYQEECQRESSLPETEQVHRALYIGLKKIDADRAASIVITSDADETPNVRAIRWLQTVAPLHPQNTYEFKSTMPTFVYSFKWCRGTDYAMATARTLERELQFWQYRISNLHFQQRVVPIGVVPSGYHANNFDTPQGLLTKWYNAVPNDGISMYDLYNKKGGIDRLRDRMAQGLPPNPNEPRLMPGYMCPRT